MTLLGIDIGTGSSKGVLADRDGNVLRRARRDHRTSTPRPGWFEHDPEKVWWGDVVALCRELVQDGDEPVRAVCVSGIGPTVVVTDAQGTPLRPAILYGIDTRSAQQVDEQNHRIGEDQLIRRAGNVLSTQSVGPKLQWIAEAEPDTWARSRHLHSAPSWMVHRLTGEHTMDRYSASTSDPLYDLTERDWWDEMWEPYAGLARPRLAWPSDIVGVVRANAAAETGIPAGVPVLAGTIDALAEAYSIGCSAVGDTMVMYGSTLFMIQTVSRRIATTRLWSAEGRTADTFSLAAGMSTGGLVTNWLVETSGQRHEQLAAAAGLVPPGSDGLLLLPYFAGERTPILDPAARGTWVGLTLDHTPGHLYRSALEGIALGVRHNLDAMVDAGAQAERLVAVGGGTAQRVWIQIVSDVTGLPQDLPTVTIGAAYGDARMAAEAIGIDTTSWNPVAERLTPSPDVADRYQALYEMYQSTYASLAPTMHRLAATPSAAQH